MEGTSTTNKNGDCCNIAGNSSQNLRQPDVSDETFDHPCQPCLDEDKNIESKKYCLECCEFLCETCIIYHKKFKATKTHELINKTDVKREQPKQLLDECFQHSGKHIELFCESHNQLCCSTCRNVYHNECTGVVSIAEAASKVADSQELKEVVVELNKTQTELGNVIKKREHDGERIESEKDTALKVLESTREKVIEIFDTLKLLDQNKIVKKAESFILDIHEDIDKCSDEMATLNDTLTVLNDSGEDNLNRFVKMKRAKQNIISASALSDITLTKAGGESLVYSENPEMITNFLTFKQFGKIEKIAGIKTISKQNKLRAAYSSEQSVQIESMCDMHQPQSLMFTDSTNLNLKCIDVNYGIQQLQKFDKKPGDVCKLGAYNYAVALPCSNQVKIFQYLRGKYNYTELHNINTRSACNSLAFHNSSLYIACAGVDMTSIQGQGYIDIYSTDAKHLRSITCDAIGQRLTHSPYRLASYQNCEFLYVLERGLGLLKFNKHAENKPIVTKLPKFERGGINVNEKGHVFVLDYVGNKINLYGPNEVEVGPILSEMDGIVKPTAVMYMPNYMKLYVALENCSEVLVYDIVYDS